MARLNVQAAVRWIGFMPDEVLPGVSTFQDALMMVALSVTNQDGVMVDPLFREQIHVAYQDLNDVVPVDKSADVGGLVRMGPTSGGTGFYSFSVSPQDPNRWEQDEVFLCVTVHRGADTGQTIVLAKYHRGL